MLGLSHIRQLDWSYYISLETATDLLTNILYYQINNWHIVMSTEQVQVDDKKVSSVEMTTMEKHNSVEVGEISDISEQDIGTHTRRHPEAFQPSDEISCCRGRIHRRTIQATSKKDRSIPAAAHVVVLRYPADRQDRSRDPSDIRVARGYWTPWAAVQLAHYRLLYSLHISCESIL
jgi:hypothetical protein